MGHSAVTSVLALGVLAYDHPVQISGVAVTQWRGGPAEDACGAHVGVLLERLAEGEAEAPEGNVVGYIC